jgi:hypothetical protein
VGGAPHAPEEAGVGAPAGRGAAASKHGEAASKHGLACSSTAN